MSDRKIEDASASSPKPVGANAVTAAARSAVDQSLQGVARVGESMSQGARATTAATSDAMSRIADAARTTAAGSAETIRAGMADATTNVTSTMERTMTTTEDFLSFGQGNIEAIVKSGQIWTAGLQDLGRHFAQSAQAQFDGTMSAFKAMASVKSVHEAVELQSTMARNALEKVVLDSGKLTDASMKLAEQTMAPLTARVTLAAERFGRVAA